MFALVMVAAFGSSVPVLIADRRRHLHARRFRIARALAVNVNAQDFVHVARARGEGAGYIVRAEILPNMIHPMLADFGLRFVFIVLLLSGLSFLGLGVQPPERRLGLAGAREHRRPAEGARRRAHAGDRDRHA